MPHPVLSRGIVLHADDFGMNSAVNGGIVQAFRRGLLTSTSLLANAPAADEARREWPALIADLRAGRLKSVQVRKDTQDPGSDFDLGIHLNLTQGAPISGSRYPAELLNEQGQFPGIGTLFFRLQRLGSNHLPAVADELRSQIEWMYDNQLKPIHLNGHQYVELIPQIAAMIPGLVRRYSIPVVRVAREFGLFRSVFLQGRPKEWGLGLVKRNFANAFQHRLRQTHLIYTDRYFGTCHAGLIDVRTLENYLRNTGSSRRIEVGLHPGLESGPHAVPPTDPWFDPLRDLRPRELNMLCSEELRLLLRRSGWQPGRLTQLTCETSAASA